MLKFLKNIIISLSLMLLIISNKSLAKINYKNNNLFYKINDIEKYALKKSDRSYIAKTELDEVKSSQINKYSYIYPKISYNARLDYGTKWNKYNNEESGIQLKSNIKIDQPIYYGGKIFYEKKIGDIVRQIGEKKFIQSKDLLKQEVINNFLDLMFKYNNISLNKYFQKKIKFNYLNFQKQYYLGEISKKNIIEQLMHYRESLINFSILEREFINNLNQFSILTKVNSKLILSYLNEDINHLLTSKYLLSNINKYKNNLINFNKTYSIFFLEKELEIEKINLKKINSDKLPHITFNSIIEYDPIVNEYNNMKFFHRDNKYISYNVGSSFSLNWDLFSGFITEGHKIGVKARKEKLTKMIQLKNKYDSLNLKNLKLKVLKLEKKILFSQEQYKLFLSNHISMLENFRIGNLSPEEYENFLLNIKYKENDFLHLIIEFININNQITSLTLN